MMVKEMYQPFKPCFKEMSTLVMETCFIFETLLDWIPTLFMCGSAFQVAQFIETSTSKSTMADTYARSSYNNSFTNYLSTGQSSLQQ
jgi:hypothetical protein